MRTPASSRIWRLAPCVPSAIFFGPSWTRSTSHTSSQAGLRRARSGRNQPARIRLKVVTEVAIGRTRTHKRSAPRGGLPDVAIEGYGSRAAIAREHTAPYRARSAHPGTLRRVAHAGGGSERTAI